MTPVIPAVPRRPDAADMEPRRTTSPIAKRLFSPLRRDHRRVLAHLDELEEVMGTRGRRTVPERPLRDLVAHLEPQFATHMRVEDDVLYPALEQALPEAAVPLAALRDDHRELRGLLAALAMRLEQPRNGVRDEQLRVLARDLVDLLRLHVSREERIVFTVASRVLRDDELTTLAGRIELAIPSNPRGVARHRSGKAS